jgi:hypothetical protein
MYEDFILKVVGVLGVGGVVLRAARGIVARSREQRGVTVYRFPTPQANGNGAEEKAESASGAVSGHSR